MRSFRCPHCGKWIGAMEVHDDCARKTDEAREAQFCSVWGCHCRATIGGMCVRHAVETRRGAL